MAPRYGEEDAGAKRKKKKKPVRKYRPTVARGGESPPSTPRRAEARRAEARSAAGGAAGGAPRAGELDASLTYGTSARPWSQQPSVGAAAGRGAAAGAGPAAPARGAGLFLRALHAPLRSGLAAIAAACASDAAAGDAANRVGAVAADLCQVCERYDAAWRRGVRPWAASVAAGGADAAATALGTSLEATPPDAAVAALEPAAGMVYSWLGAAVHGAVLDRVGTIRRAEASRLLVERKRAVTQLVDGAALVASNGGRALDAFEAVVHAALDGAVDASVGGALAAVVERFGAVFPRHAQGDAAPGAATVAAELAALLAPALGEDARHAAAGGALKMFFAGLAECRAQHVAQLREQPGADAPADAAPAAPGAVLLYGRALVRDPNALLVSAAPALLRRLSSPDLEAALQLVAAVARGPAAPADDAAWFAAAARAAPVAARVAAERGLADLAACCADIATAACIDDSGAAAKYYPGEISRVHSDGTFDVDYDDGAKETRVAAALVKPLGEKETRVDEKLVRSKDGGSSAAEGGFTEGDKVEARYKGKDKYYPGRVARVRIEGTIDVDYDDGETEKGVAADLVKPVGGGGKADERKLEVDDKVEARYKGEAKYYPGVIARAHINGMFDVDYDDGKKEKRVVAALVKRLGGGKDDDSRHDLIELRVDDRVEARFRGKADYQPGKIAHVNADGTFVVKYDDGQKETRVVEALIKPLCGKVDRRLNVDDKVEARYEGKEKYYPGRIALVNADRTYDVDYDGGEKETRVPNHFVRRPGGDETRVGKLREGAKVKARYRGKSKFYPGRISRDRGDGTFDVDYDDGEKETRVVAELITAVGGDDSSPPRGRLSQGARVEARRTRSGPLAPENRVGVLLEAIHGDADVGEALRPAVEKALRDEACPEAAVFAKALAGLESAAGRSVEESARRARNVVGLEIWATKSGAYVSAASGASPAPRAARVGRRAFLGVVAATTRFDCAKLLNDDAALWAPRQALDEARDQGGRSQASHDVCAYLLGASWPLATSNFEKTPGRPQRTMRRAEGHVRTWLCDAVHAPQSPPAPRTPRHVDVAAALRSCANLAAALRGKVFADSARADGKRRAKGLANARYAEWLVERRAGKCLDRLERARAAARAADEATKNGEATNDGDAANDGEAAPTDAAATGGAAPPTPKADSDAEADGAPAEAPVSTDAPAADDDDDDDPAQLGLYLAEEESRAKLKADGDIAAQARVAVSLDAAAVVAHAAANGLTTPTLKVAAALAARFGAPWAKLQAAAPGAAAHLVRYGVPPPTRRTKPAGDNALESGPQESRQLGPDWAKMTPEQIAAAALGEADAGGVWSEVRLDSLTTADALDVDAIAELAAKAVSAVDLAARDLAAWDPSADAQAAPQKRHRDGDAPPRPPSAARRARALVRAFDADGDAALSAAEVQYACAASRGNVYDWTGGSAAFGAAVSRAICGAKKVDARALAAAAAFGADVSRAMSDAIKVDTKALVAAAAAAAEGGRGSSLWLQCALRAGFSQADAPSLISAVPAPSLISELRARAQKGVSSAADVAAAVSASGLRCDAALLCVLAERFSSRNGDVVVDDFVSWLVPRSRTLLLRVSAPESGLHLVFEVEAYASVAAVRARIQRRLFWESHRKAGISTVRVGAAPSRLHRAELYRGGAETRGNPLDALDETPAFAAFADREVLTYLSAADAHTEDPANRTFKDEARLLQLRESQKIYQYGDEREPRRSRRLAVDWTPKEVGAWLLELGLPKRLARAAISEKVGGDAVVLGARGELRESLGVPEAARGAFDRAAAQVRDIALRNVWAARPVRQPHSWSAATVAAWLVREGADVEDGGLVSHVARTVKLDGAEMFGGGNGAVCSANVLRRHLGAYADEALVGRLRFAAIKLRLSLYPPLALPEPEAEQPPVKVAPRKKRPVRAFEPEPQLEPESRPAPEYDRVFSRSVVSRNYDVLRREAFPGGAGRGFLVVGALASLGCLEDDDEDFGRRVFDAFAAQLESDADAARDPFEPLW